MKLNMSSDTAQVSSLPLPPMHYINLYTDENVKRNRAPLPPRPVHDTYSMFGSSFNAEDNIIRSLESQGFKRLYPVHFDRRRELKKLNHSLLVNFLDLLDLLVNCPESPKRAEKVEDLSLLFIHIHHLLNEFRPHQARETLRVMMELQKRQRVETAMRCKEVKPIVDLEWSLCGDCASQMVQMEVECHMPSESNHYLEQFYYRFQKHLGKVQDILQNALQSLPDQADPDSLFLMPTDVCGHNTNQNDGANVDPCHELDRLMCNIIDNMR